MVKHCIVGVLICLLWLLSTANVFAFTQYTTGTLTVSPSTIYIGTGDAAVFTLTINGDVAGGQQTGSADLYRVVGSIGTKVGTIAVDKTTKRGTLSISVSSNPFNNEPGDYAFFARIPWEETGGYSDTSPSITVSVRTNIVREHDVWWFDDAVPDVSFGYYCESDLIASGVTTGQFKWVIESGGDKVVFKSNGSTTLYTSINQATIKSIGRSTGATQVTNDIGIHMYWKRASDPSYTSAGWHDMAVFAPHYLVNYQNEDIPAGNGYQSKIHYKTYDQFSRALPASFPINEDWASATSDFQGENWIARNGESENQEGSAVVGFDWYDNMTRAQQTGWNPPQYTVPPAQQPQNPLGNVAVEHWLGKWRVGSLVTYDGENNNRGIVVRNLSWQLYQDHGRNYIVQ